VFRLWQGTVYVSESLFPLGAFVDQHIHRRGKIGAGGSVATSTWDVARQIGCSTLYTAGIDLGFPGNSTHCRGSFFEERLFRQGTRLAPAEQGLTSYLHSGSPYHAPATGGGTVVTDQRMEVYRDWFTEQVRQHPEITTAVLAPGGVYVTGLELAKPFDTDRKNVPEKAHVTATPPRQANITPANPVDISQYIREFVQLLILQLNTLAGTMEEGLRCATTLLSQEDIRPQDLAQLDQFDQALMNTEHRELVGFLAEEALSNALSKNVSTPREGVEQAIAVYRALHNAVLYHRELLNRYRLK
jgi:hypothetical protein